LLQALIICSITVALLVPPATGEAQGCLDFVKIIENWTSQTPAVPSTMRAHGVEKIYWNGKPYIFVNDGNGLRIYRISDSKNPVYISRKTFSCFGGCGLVPPADHDWTHTNLSVCSNCRYGVSHLWFSGTVLFDLGTDTTKPTIIDMGLYDASTKVEGAFTFSHGSQQYLIINEFDNGCGVNTPSPTATLFKMDGVDPGDLTNIQCLEKAGGQGFYVSNGIYLTNSQGSFVYLFDTRSKECHIFKVTGSGSSLQLKFQGSPIMAASRFGRSTRVDPGSNYLISAVGGPKLYDISDLSLPIMVKNLSSLIPPEIVTNISRAAIAYPYVWLAVQADRKTYTIDITNPNEPVLLDPEFWSTSNYWNNPDELLYVKDYDAEFSSDLSALYLARFSVVQLVSPDQCGPGVAPAANLTVTPSPAFPGDTITVTNTSTGLATASAIWVTNEYGEEVCGSSALSAGTLTTLDCVIDQDLGVDQTFTAHIAVENEDNEYNPEVPGDQYKSQAVSINRIPKVEIVLDPEALTTGNKLSLRANAEGHPARVNNSNAYTWTIQPPTGPAETKLGRTIELDILISGDYSFCVEVEYQHYQTQDQNYTTESCVDKSYSSVAADFVIVQGATPCSDDAITLDARSSKIPEHSNVSYSWEISKGGASPLFPSCDSSSQECDLPPDYLQIGIPYDVKLTLRNMVNNDVSTIVKERVVTPRDCGFAPVISASTVTPDIGALVTFTVSGVEGLKSTKWNFAGAGCDGYSQIMTCDSDSSIMGCWNQSFRFSSAGTRNVTVEVTNDSNQTATAGPLVVTVGSDGNCPGETNCSYTVTPASASFNSSGGSGSFSVDVSGSGCSWSPITNLHWISITSGSGTQSSDGIVRYSIDANTSGDRNGSIRVDTQYHNIYQAGSSNLPVDFTISESNPKIGQQITFQANSGLDVTSWNFGDVNCDGGGPVSTCGIVRCETKNWTYKSAGTKTITLVTAQGSQSRTVTVQNTGMCEGDCELGGKPDADFTMSPNPAIAGDQVTFTHSSSDDKTLLLGAEKEGTVAKAGVDFSWSPDPPKIGGLTLFTVSFAGTLESTSWDFGEEGCDRPRLADCTASATKECNEKTHKFASSGTKTVSLTARVSGHTYTRTKDVTVSEEGYCNTGPTCTYTINPTTKSFDASGGNGTVNVSVADGCNWTATSHTGWVTITNGNNSGSGNGQVTFSVAANTSVARSGSMTIAGRPFTVSQQAGSTGGGGGNDATEWLWEITDSDGDLIATRNQPSFSYTFDEIGTYSVKLTTSNCRGSDIAIQQLEVTELQLPSNYVVPAAAHIAGADDTMWLSDLKVFNRDSKRVSIDLKFLPENQSSNVTYGYTISLDPLETANYPDVLSKIPGVGGTSVKGGLLFVFEEGGGVMPAIMSRTFNTTPGGTYGQFMPAMPIVKERTGTFYITGLISNDDYRTNVGFANAGNAYADDIRITMLDPFGSIMGEPHVFGIRKRNTTQILNLPQLCGVTGDIDLYSLKIEAGDHEVVVYASKVDKRSSDPTTLTHYEISDSEVIVPGVAHLAGVNDSEWRSDVTMFNPTDETTITRIDVIFQEDLGIDSPYIELELPSLATQNFVDILAPFLMAEEGGAKGYLRVSSIQGPVPMIAARTYNQTLENGTLGQAIMPYLEESLIGTNESGHIPGLCNSSSSTEGFRTNIGVVNTNTEVEATVDINLYDEDGTNVGFKRLTLDPGEFRQFNIFALMGLGDQDIETSAVILVRSGGPVAAYTSTVDNQTGDSFFINFIH
jgi:PKD repeat protein